MPLFRIWSVRFDVVLVCALLLGLASPVKAAELYEINVIVSLTGPGSFLGKSEQATLQLLESRINKQGGIGGRPLKLIFSDDQSNPQTAVQLTNTVLQKNPSVIVGASLVASCNAMSALMKTGPVQYCLSSGFHPAKGSYGFSFGVSTDDLIAVTIRYFHDRGWNKVAIIASTDATGQDGERGIDAALSKYKDMTVTTREHFGSGDISVSAQMARIKASNPQALITWASGTPMGTLLHGIKDAGLTIPVTASASNLSYEEFKQYEQLLPSILDIAAMPSLGYDSLPKGPVKKAVGIFVDTLREAGIHPDNTHSIPWDAMNIVVDALRRLGPNATATQIRDYISNLHGWAGILGEYDFRDGSQRGVGEQNGIVVRWDPKRDTWTAVSKFGGALR